MKQPDRVMEVRSELQRISVVADITEDKDELKGAVRDLSGCVLALMDSFGIHDVHVRPSRLATAQGEMRRFIFEQRAIDGKILKTVSIGAAGIITLEGDDDG